MHTHANMFIKKRKRKRVYFAEMKISLLKREKKTKQRVLFIQKVRWLIPQYKYSLLSWLFFYVFVYLANIKKKKNLTAITIVRFNYFFFFFLLKKAFLVK